MAEFGCYPADKYEGTRGRSHTRQCDSPDVASHEPDQERVQVGKRRRIDNGGQQQSTPSLTAPLSPVQDTSPMSLVDYSSSSASDEETAAAQRRKDGPRSASRCSTVAGGAPESAMPPLPAAFHDLYASTVRQSVVDDPSLHQGRKRQTPHIRGNWPTHLYVEWHPTQEQHDTLEELITLAGAELGGGVKLHGFLTSQLGAHLPLHMSLSRPLSLPSADREAFFEKLRRSMRAAGTGAFSVRPRGLSWYKSPGSERAFLVLGVATSTGADTEAPANAELVALLTRCNAVSTLFNQPALYQTAGGDAVDGAFHISIGWTLGLPGEDASLRVLELLRLERFREVPSWEIDVSCVKAKMGNVVRQMALVGSGKGGGPASPLHHGL